MYYIEWPPTRAQPSHHQVCRLSAPQPGHSLATQSIPTEGTLIDA